MASGTEILSYKGSPELGIGTDVASLGSGQDNLANFNHVQSQIMAQDMAWNTMQYQQKIKDRDDTANLISQQDIDVDVDDKDRPELQKKLDEIQNLWVQNPDLKSNSDAYMQVKKKIQEFNGMKVSAKTRAVVLKQMDLDYANNPDAEDRARQGKWIQEQRDKGIYHMVDPYQKEQSFDMKNIVLPTKDVPSVEWKVDKNGVAVKYTTTKPDIDDVFNEYAKAAVEAEGKNIPNQWAAYYEHAKANPDFMSDKNLLAMNDKLAEINKAEGWQEGNPRYRYPLAEKDADGNWQLKANPFDLALDTKLVNEYGGVTKSEVDPKYNTGLLDTAKRKKEESIVQLNRQKGRTETAHQAAFYSTAAMNRAHAGLYNAMKDKVVKEGEILDDKHDKMLSDGAAPISEATNAFFQAYRTQSTLSKASALSQSWKDKLGITDDWTYSDVPKNNSLVKMTATPVLDEKGHVVGKNEPALFRVLRSPDGDFNKTKIVGLSKDGKKIISIVDANTGFSNIIKYDSDFKRTEKTINLENSSRFVLEKLQGSKAQGVDMNAVIQRNGVVNTTDMTGEGGDGATTSDNGPGVAKMSDYRGKVIKRSDGKYIKVNGKLRKIKKVDPDNDVLSYE